MVLDALWSAAGKSRAETALYAVLDGARNANIYHALRKSSFEYECLYRGELDPDLAEAAPYLLRLERDMPFVHWLAGEGWGNSWGIFLLSAASLRDMRQHLRKFLMVYDPRGKPLYFRYYDPRVLRIYLPTCNAEELRTFFGPIQHVMLEDDDSTTLVRFTAAAGSLQQEKIPVTVRASEA
jgi:hypothetical protein